MFSDSYLEVAAAKAGLGLACVPLDLVSEELAQGVLIRVLQPYTCSLDGLYLYYPHRNVSPALRLVVDTLKM